MSGIALPRNDPAYGRVVEVLSDHAGQPVSPSEVDSPLLAELLQVVVEDRLRIALDGQDTDSSLDKAISDGLFESMDESGDNAGDEATILVQSGVTALGVYVAEIVFDADTTRMLKPDEVAAYCDALSRGMATAQYDAAVMRQLHNVAGLTVDDAVWVRDQLRQTRPHLDQQAVRPMIVRPSVGQRTGKPFLDIRLKGSDLRWTWFPDEVAEHVRAVREVSITADLDFAYRKVLSTDFGLDDGRARVYVDGLRKWRDEPNDPH